MTKLFLPTEAKPTLLLPPAADAAGRSSPFISLKNAGRAYLVAILTQGNAAPIPLTISQALDVSGASAKPLALAVPTYSVEDADATDTWVRQPDGVGFTTTAAVKSKLVLFALDPTLLDVNNGFDCVSVATGASNAANITSVLAFLTDFRYGDSRATARSN